MTFTMYHYHFMYKPSLPITMPGPLTYIVAANGIFLWAKRDGLEVLIPVQPCAIRGLYPALPFVHLLELSKVPAILLEQMLVSGSQARRIPDHKPVESLFLLSKTASGWQLIEPPQEREPTRVTLKADQLDHAIYANTLMEVHTHPQPGMAAYFSKTDDEDERGFRLYAVIGNINVSPNSNRITAEIRMRVVVYDIQTAYEFPASWVMQLPDGLVECPSSPSEELYRVFGGSWSAS